MADPVIPGGLRVQFILKGKSGLPDDKFVTTWAFQTIDGLPPTVGQNVAAKDLVVDFFNGITAPQTSPVRTFLSSAINANDAEARVYRLGDSVPREPTIYPFTLIGVSSNSLPSEVAAVASFFSLRNLPRRRGRVFIGPLGQSAAAVDTNQVPRLSAGLTTALVESSKRLRAAAPVQGLNWSVLSQVDAVMRPVTGGWADNAFDTQRRRGEDATSRVKWAQAGT